MRRTVKEGCIASCVRCSLLPDRTHKSYLLRSTAIKSQQQAYINESSGHAIIVFDICSFDGCDYT